MLNDKEEIRKHYNALPNRSVDDRRNTRNIRIRAMNNFIKFSLIRRYIRPGDSVLDIGVGKGGDLPKYRNAEIAELYGLDVANKSILDAIERARSGGYKFKMVFKTRDALTAPISLGKQFDVVSIQFSFHYAFAKEEYLTTAVNNIARHLKSRGYVLITVPSKNEILKRIDSGYTSNNYYKIEPRGRWNDSLYGNGYFYTLVDSLESCIEYLVDVSELTRKMSACGLSLVERTPFAVFVENARNDDPGLYDRMCYSRMSREEWEVVTLHTVLVFQKRSN